MVQDRNLKAPLDIANTVGREAKRAEEFVRVRKLRLSENQFQALEADLKKKVESWKRQTRPMRNRLVEANDLLEGVVEETNFPFEGASNITLHYAAGTARTFKSVFNRTVYQDPDIFMARPNAGYQTPQIDDLQDAINASFAQDCNGLDTLKDGTIPCFRDGTLIVSGSWDRRIEQTNDCRVYKSDLDFKRDYPDAEAAGMEQEAYDAILDSFLLDPAYELKVTFNYDFVKFDGPEYEIIPLAKFVYWPSYAPSISRLDLYGRAYQYSMGDLLIDAKRGKLYQAKVDALGARNSGMSIDEWQRSRDFAEGVIPVEAADKPVALMDLAYKYDLDGDGIPEKYLVTFAPEDGLLLSAERYPIRRNVDFCIDFGFLHRDGRFLRPSLLMDSMDLFELMDTIHRHRNNVRMLVASPIFLINKNYKDQMDLGRAENVIRPGVSFWVDDIDRAARQLRVENLDQPGNSLDEENLLTRYIELLIGPTQGLSGKETPSDPRAPMGKTLALMNQANQRIDDYIDEFRKSIPALAELHTALLYQYGPEMSQFTVSRGGKPMQIEVPREIFAVENVKWGFRKRSVVFSPEFAMQRLGGLIAIYTQLLPAMLQGDPISIEIWKRMVMSSGEPDAQTLLFQPPAPLGLPAPPGMPQAGGPLSQFQPLATKPPSGLATSTLNSKEVVAQAAPGVV